MAVVLHAVGALAAELVADYVAGDGVAGDGVAGDGKVDATWVGDFRNRKVTR